MCLIVGSLKGVRGTTHIEVEQPHKQERDYTFTQNLKAMRLWVILLIRCLTFTFVSDLRYVTHTCTQHNTYHSDKPHVIGDQVKYMHASRT